MNHCADCRFWQKHKKVTKNIPGETGDVWLGTCRRFPPHTYWPGTREDDWCGEFKAAEIVPITVDFLPAGAIPKKSNGS